MGLEMINVFKKELNWTNEDISKASGVPKPTIDKITAGRTCNPNLDTVQAIVHALGHTLDDLFQNERTAPAQTEQELSKKDHQIIAMLPYVPERIKDSVLMLLDATVDLVAAQESLERNADSAEVREERLDDHGQRERRIG